MMDYIYLVNTNVLPFIFADCDFLFTRDVLKALEPFLHDSKAVMVVKHDYEHRTLTKMGGVTQHMYRRKNWSSFIVWNLRHEANDVLDASVVNPAEPSWLHHFQWLDNEEIGELPADFNFLVGEYQPQEDASIEEPTPRTPTCLHYTLGIGPYVPPVQDYAKLWENYRRKLVGWKHLSPEPMRGPMMETIAGYVAIGLDRAALDVALELNIPCGGWCPKGRKAEDGRIEDWYPLEETPSSDYRVRTRLNVEEADGTLVLTRGPVTSGTDLTIKLAREKRKPHLIIDLNQNPDPVTVQKWLKGENIRILNVAGPRESKMPGLHPVKSAPTTKTASKRPIREGELPREPKIAG